MLILFSSKAFLRNIDFVEVNMRNMPQQKPENHKRIKRY